MTSGGARLVVGGAAADVLRGAARRRARRRASPRRRSPPGGAARWSSRTGRSAMCWRRSGRYRHGAVLCLRASTCARRVSGVFCGRRAADGVARDRVLPRPARDPSDRLSDFADRVSARRCRRDALEIFFGFRHSEIDAIASSGSRAASRVRGHNSTGSGDGEERSASRGCGDELDGCGDGVRRLCGREGRRREASLSPQERSGIVMVYDIPAGRGGDGAQRLRREERPASAL